MRFEVEVGSRFKVEVTVESQDKRVSSRVLGINLGSSLGLGPHIWLGLGASPKLIEVVLRDDMLRYEVDTYRVCLFLLKTIMGHLVGK